MTFSSAPASSLDLAQFALDLQLRGVSDFESIDRTWMITPQAGMGPFGMMDRMGPGVVCHVAKLTGETTPNAGARVCPIPRRALHPEASWCSDRPGLLPLSESGLRAAGIHLYPLPHCSAPPP